ncbi:MAG: RNA polymerase factor sigma-54 [Bacillota bacterium]
MKMGYELIIEQQQKLVMTPELRLALKILQLPAVELDELIQHELETNPILEVAEEVKEEKGESQSKQELEKKISQKENDIDWKEYLQYQGKSHYLEHFESDDSHETSYDNMITYTNTLKDHLLFQLNLSFVKHELREIGEFIIESLDENGYLTISVEEIAAILKVAAVKVEKVLGIVQTFEPLGIGARDLKECLMIQLRNKGLLTDRLELIVSQYLDDIACNRISVIAKKLSITTEEAQKQCDVIKSLEPKPGRAFESSSATRYVIPDVYIDKVGNEYVLSVNDHNGSRLTINQFYKSILRSEDKASHVSEYISGKLSSAMWLIRSLEHRRNTLYNVMKAILDYQIEFFERGVMYLKTMTLKNIADLVNVHESTVSRAINGKYVQTPRGIFEIKYFFKSGVDNQDGDSVSSESVKKLIKKFISEEVNTKPLSDQCLADTLAKMGYVISRRTVAKYRDELGIPSSSKRKRYI